MTDQYAAFWTWFTAHEKKFYDVVITADRDTIDKQFFEPLMERLNAIREGYFFLTGLNEDTAELIITADGEVKNIVFVEELVALAPVLANWRFIADKPESDIDYTTIHIHDFIFSLENLFFYAKEDAQHPDKINITIVHDSYDEAEKGKIIPGVYIFLDNLLGEVKSITMIDSVEVIGPDQAELELIPVVKLKAYLEWRQKEFIEKYEDVYYDTANDNFTGMQASTQSDSPVLILVNSGALEWHGSASHPWILQVAITYEGDEQSALPDAETNQLMDVIEADFLAQLPVSNGHIYLGRETYENNRYLYIASQDFRIPAKVSEAMTEKYAAQLPVEWDIFKDKYWQSLERFW
ncbi:DUF695 domain-containing protein [Chitinophaga rhizophila]|uniref:DUF695 domain-containing protein n=1 Tax=Chitinophaga rhizophila TaxID=2866212 RepID=A0ABS7GHL9_9BACT|nr:DUF695 domain-containing protein [Chitinophaga rhizophila]MBW8687187.1 DUF695 domain-containing protein [Chitinophaga rhizophila]